MIQGGDFVKVSFKSCLEDTSVQFYAYILYTVMWIYFLDYISKECSLPGGFYSWLHVLTTSHMLHTV